jgi:hypothetical protein
MQLAIAKYLSALAASEAEELAAVVKRGTSVPKHDV